MSDRVYLQLGEAMHEKEFEVLKEVNENLRQRNDMLINELDKAYRVIGKRSEEVFYLTQELIASREENNRLYSMIQNRHEQRF